MSTNKIIIYMFASLFASILLAGLVAEHCDYKSIYHKALEKKSFVCYLLNR